MIRFVLAAATFGVAGCEPKIRTCRSEIARSPNQMCGAYYVKTEYLDFTSTQAIVECQTGMGVGGSGGPLFSHPPEAGMSFMWINNAELEIRIPDQAEIRASTASNLSGAFIGPEHEITFSIRRAPDSSPDVAGCSPQ